MTTSPSSSSDKMTRNDNESSSPEPLYNSPDGGPRAWFVAFGAMLCCMVSFGWINGNGLFQAYYASTILREESTSKIAWISSLGFFFLYFGAIIVGKLASTYGPRPILISGTILHVGGLLATSFCTKYWHFILAQGLCSGMGSSAIFFSSVVATSTWFSTHQSLAIGIAASGSSLGGVLFPSLINTLLPTIGFGWTVRAADFIILILLTIAIIAIKEAPNLPKLNVPLSNINSKDRAYWLTTLGALLFCLGYFVTIIFLVVIAQSRGMSQSINALVILNAASFPGRILPGALADEIGRYNTVIIMNSISAILSLTLYIPSTSVSGMYTFCILFGFFSAAMVFLAPTLVMQISKREEVNVKIAVTYAFISVGALTGSPIAGAIVTADEGRVGGLQGFAGGLMAVGCVLFVVARLQLKGWKVGVVV